MGQKLRTEEKRILAQKLFEEHGAAVFRFALRLAGNRTVAEDITSDTILVALEKVQRNESIDLTRNYLFGITINKWRRTRPSPSQTISEMLAADATNLDQLLDLERAFRTLPQALQEAFVLVKAEGLTSKEAAEILKIPQGTVQSRVHDAVHQMRNILHEPLAPTAIFSEVKP
ncbi:MAG: RNA polymerase sigma factor [Armatimonadota bacterium]